MQIYEILFTNQKALHPTSLKASGFYGSIYKMEQQYNLVVEIYELWEASGVANGWDHKITQTLSDAFYQEKLLFEALEFLRYGEEIG